MCSGLVMASNTSARGASKSRVMRISRSDGVVTVKVALFAAVLAGMSLLLVFQLLQVGVESIETGFPDRAVPLGPVGNVLEGRRLDPARAPLRFPAAGDEPGALEHAQVLRDGRHAHLEGLGELGHGALAGREPGQDGPAGRVGESRKRGTEVVSVHRDKPSSYITY